MYMFIYTYFIHEFDQLCRHEDESDDKGDQNIGFFQLLLYFALIIYVKLCKIVIWFLPYFFCYDKFPSHPNRKCSTEYLMTWLRTGYFAALMISFHLQKFLNSKKIG